MWIDYIKFSTIKINQLVFSHRNPSVRSYNNMIIQSNTDATSRFHKTFCLLNVFL